MIKWWGAHLIGGIIWYHKSVQLEWYKVYLIPRWLSVYGFDWPIPTLGNWNNLLPNNQHGFRARRSTMTACLVQYSAWSGDQFRNRSNYRSAVVGSLSSIRHIRSNHKKNCSLTGVCWHLLNGWINSNPGFRGVPGDEVRCSSPSRTMLNPYSKTRYKRYA